jgi:hypothetical protein
MTGSHEVRGSIPLSSTDRTEGLSQESGAPRTQAGVRARNIP